MLQYQHCLLPMESNVTFFFATKAFIVHDGKILILQESSKYLDGTNKQAFDVVGGRLTPGEYFLDALKREIQEETGITDIEIGRPFFVNEWRPVVKGNQWQIVGVFFECFAKTSKVTLSEDHSGYEWIDPKEYEDYPIIENLKKAFEAYNK